ncbi:MAG: FtsX-like permease family protein [Phycisphaerae bacterium]|nr:FtsX-like permease family protein [Phycisphaerae bacterium]
MYKLFLCLRYLRSKAFAYFGMLCVALSVCLMLISVSVFTGFLNKIEKAAKGLFGDIVIEPYGERGLAHYDEFIAEITKIPDVEAADPFILGLGVLSVEGDSHYRQTVQIAGIRLPSRARVTDFEEGLFVQEGTANPTFDVPLNEAVARLEVYQKFLRAIVEREFAAELATLTPERRQACFQSGILMEHYLTRDEQSAGKRQLLRRLSSAYRNLDEAKTRLEQAQLRAGELAALRDELAQAKQRGATADEQLDLKEKIEDITDAVRIHPAGNRVILGLGIPGLTFRTDKGETIRYLMPGHNIFLYVVPLGRRFTSEGIQPNIGKFTIIDDNLSGVHSIDSKMVYIPFDTLQTLNNMYEEVSPDDPSKVVEPKRCSQIHVKVRGENLTEPDLRRTAAKIQELWGDFLKRHPDAAVSDVGIETWRQRQQQVVEPLEKQRTLVIIVIAVIWVVVVVLIFVIFYTIVTQKTREIGVLKAVGASGWGVAGVFLGYGAVVGLIGSVVGTLGGWVFVKNINAIQDWVADVFGYRVWSRDQFMFDLIPNEVDWNAAIFILASSILAGLLGALLPAIRAARMQPVEALRYE